MSRESSELHRMEARIAELEDDKKFLIGERDEVAFENGELEAEALENEAQIRADMKEIRILKAENKRLMEAARGYAKGGHYISCNVERTRDLPCNCGYSALVALLERGE